MQMFPTQPLCSNNKNLFDPPLSIQRYMFVRNFLYENHKSYQLKSVCDLGSNNCRLSMYLKQLPFMEKIICVDLSEENLANSQYNAGPNIMDRLLTRENRLVVELYVGSALEKDCRISNVDVVTCIELIEHLQPETIDLLAENIFGFIRPRIAIVSTPNFEYNKLIKAEAAKNACTNEDCEHVDKTDMIFRDEDHKFEWTRPEFKEWCDGIFAKYPEYHYRLDGVGRLKSDLELLVGYASQIAIFTKLEQVCNDSGDAIANNCNNGHDNHEDGKELSESCSLYRSYIFG